MRAPATLPDRTSHPPVADFRRKRPAPPSGEPGEFLLPIAKLPRFTLSFAAFLVYLFVTHSYRVPIATEAMVAAMLGLLIEPGKLRVPPAFYWCLGLLAWAAVTITLADSDWKEWSVWQEYVKVLLILIVASNVARTPTQTSAFLIFWLACFALWPVRGTLFNFAAGISTGGRYHWNYMFKNPNDLAAITLLILGLTLVASRSRSSRQLRAVATIGTAVLTLIIFLTQSRGAFLGLTVFALIAVSTHRRRSQAILVMSVLAALIFAVAPSSVWDRLGGLKSATSTQTLAEVDPEGSAESRFKIWQVALSISRDYPITGAGFGAYPKAHRQYVLQNAEWRGIRAISGGRDTHSAYLNVLAETGFIGLVLLLGFITTFGLFLARTAARLAASSPRRSEQFKYLFASWAAFWVASVFATNHKVVMVYVFIGFATALAAQYGIFGDGPPGSPLGQGPARAPAQVRSSRGRAA